MFSVLVFIVNAQVLAHYKTKFPLQREVIAANVVSRITTFITGQTKTSWLEIVIINTNLPLKEWIITVLNATVWSKCHNSDCPVFSSILVCFPDVVSLPLPTLSHRWQQDQLWTCPHMDGGMNALPSDYKTHTEYIIISYPSIFHSFIPVRVLGGLKPILANM